MSTRLRSAAALLLALILFAYALPAVARPGGGQSYHGGGGSSGGYHGSSSSSSSGGYHGTTGSYGGTTGYGASASGSSGDDDGGGAVVVIVIIIIIVIIYYARKHKQPERANVRVDDNVRQSALGKLNAIEVGFDEKAFNARAKATMEQVNAAWQKGNMGAARRLISDGVYVRFRTQIELLKSQGLRNYMLEPRVVDAQIIDAETDALWDTVHVKVVGEARDADVPVAASEADAQKAAGKKEQQQYQEVWSFIRRRGNKAKDGKTTLTGDCPNCGAPMPISDVVKCSHCNALVNSGEHDWVLAEITQPEEFSPFDASHEPDGLAELRKKDPTVSRQELEDRGSVAFWKWIEAQATGKREKLERFCFKPGVPAITTIIYKQVAVGSSEVTQIFNDGDHDTVELQIVWSASVGNEEPVNRTHYLKLSRAADAKSKRGLSSLDCPNCGGPLADSDLAKCNYCGEVLSGGKNEWAIADIAGEVTEGER